MSDIVERLRGPRTEQGGLWPHPNLHEEAAAEIEKLRADKAAWQGVQQGTADVVKQLEAENEKLRAALKPFADKADHHTQGAHWMDAVFTVDECRAGVAALKETTKGQDES